MKNSKKDMEGVGMAPIIAYPIVLLLTFAIGTNGMNILGEDLLLEQF